MPLRLDGVSRHAAECSLLCTRDVDNLQVWVVPLRDAEGACELLVTPVEGGLLRESLEPLLEVLQEIVEIMSRVQQGADPLRLAPAVGLYLLRGCSLGARRLKE